MAVVSVLRRIGYPRIGGLLLDAERVKLMTQALVAAISQSSVQ
jgi:hypothetical protein